MIQLGPHIYFSWLAVTFGLICMILLDSCNSKAKTEVIQGYAIEQEALLGSVGPEKLRAQISALKGESGPCIENCSTPAPEIACYEKVDTDIIQDGPLDDDEKYSIYFNFNGGGTRPDLKAALERIYDCARRESEREFTQITLYGYSDKFGEGRYNKRLARRRAETALKHLQSIDADREKPTRINPVVELIKDPSNSDCMDPNNLNNYETGQNEDCRRVDIIFKYE